MSKKKLALRPVLAVLALGVALTATIASGEEDKPTKVDGSGGGQSAAETFAVGDAVALGDWQLQVHGVTDPYVSANQFLGPAEGNRIVAVDVEVTNTGDSSEIVSSMVCFKVSDAENKSYTMTITDGIESTPDGPVAPGEAIRGTVAYEVPEAATGLQLKFQCDLLNSGSATVDLA